MSEDKRKKSRSLAFLLSTSFLRMSLAALIIAYIPQALIFIRTEFNRIEAEQNAIAKDAADQVVNFIQEKFTDLALTASLVEPGTHSQEEQVSVLTHLLAQQSSFRSVILLDTKGRELAHSTRFSEAEVASLMQRVEDLQLTLLEGDSQYISPVYINEISSEPQVVMAVPVQDVLGKQRGILLVEVNLKFMWDLVGGIQVGQTGSAFVVNNNGELLASRDISQVLAGKKLSQMRVVDRFLSGSVTPGGSIFANNENLAGKYGVATLVNLGVPNWAVITYLPMAEASRGLLNNFAISFVFVLVLAGLTALFGVFIARRQAVPLVELSNSATEVAGGNLSVTANVAGPSEIVQVASAFNEMTSRLREFITSLEQRVADRTKDLATVARISTVTSTIRDPFEMLANMVHLTQRGFGLYHAHVFVYRKDTGDLQIVACGYKEGDEHEGTHGTSVIPISQEQSLVARAARTRKPVIVNDVRSDPGWLPNPLLPDTHAELAVPMIVGDELLGVLDVQSEYVDAFSEESANIQMTLASQVATALQNAQAYTKTQKQAELETLVNSIGQKIQRTTTIEDTLQTAIRELGLAVGASRVKARIGVTSSAVEAIAMTHGENSASLQNE